MSTGEQGGSIPTDKDLDVSSFRESDFEEIFCYVTTSSSPFLGRFIEDVEYSEPLWEFILQLLEFAFKKDIVFGDLTTCQLYTGYLWGKDIAVDESDFGFVVRVFEDCFDELVHGRDSGPSCNKSYCFMSTIRIVVSLVPGDTCFLPICIWRWGRGWRGVGRRSCHGDGYSSVHSDTS